MWLDYVHNLFFGAFGKLQLLTIGSSMSVDHVGTVYWERCYGKKTTFCMYLTFLVDFNVWKIGKFFKEFTIKKTLRFFVVQYFLDPNQVGTKKSIVLKPCQTFDIIPTYMIINISKDRWVSVSGQIKFFCGYNIHPCQFS